VKPCLNDSLLQYHSDEPATAFPSQQPDSPCCQPTYPGQARSFTCCETLSTVLIFPSQNRVDETGADGLAVMQHIQRLPPTNVRRNDFSHLGITSPNAAGFDMDDAVSVISATANATIPFAQVRPPPTLPFHSLR